MWLCLSYATSNRWTGCSYRFDCSEIHVVRLATIVRAKKELDTDGSTEMVFTIVARCILFRPLVTVNNFVTQTTNLFHLKRQEGLSTLSLLVRVFFFNDLLHDSHKRDTGNNHGQIQQIGRPESYLPCPMRQRNVDKARETSNHV